MLASILTTDHHNVPASILTTDHHNVPASILTTDHNNVPASTLTTDQSAGVGHRVVTSTLLSSALRSRHTHAVISAVLAHRHF